MSESVTESVCPENLVNTICKKQWREFHPILVTDVLEFIDVLIDFRIKRWSKVTVTAITAGNDPKTFERHVSKPTKGMSPNFGHRCISVHRCADLILGSKGERSRLQQAMTQKPGDYNIFITVAANVTKIKSHVSGPGNILIRFLGQKVKGQGHSMLRHNRRWQPVELSSFWEKLSRIAGAVLCTAQMAFLKSCQSTWMQE